MHYSPEKCVEIEREWKLLLEELTHVWVSLAKDMAPKLKQESAREHIVYGAARRLLIIQHCIKNVFTIFPVSRTRILSDDERVDVEINLHAFLINTHGLPDNLAWAYVLERQIEMRPVDVGLFCGRTKAIFPEELKSYLSSERLSDWHQSYAKNYRDALAHRIPPYLPPSIYTPAHEKEYKELHAKGEQAFTIGNFNLFVELEARKHQLGIPCPAIATSFSGASREQPMLLHPQMIVDARTLIQIIGKVGPHLAVAEKSSTPETM